MRVALRQCAAATGAVATNLERIESDIACAAAAGATLVLFPEMMVSGYGIDAATASRLAEPRDGPAARCIAAAARRAGIGVAYGYPERDGDAVYNSAQLIDARGVTRLSYRKAHLFGAGERAAYRAGGRCDEVVDLGGWRIGLLICYDVEFPEAVRTLALAGADVVLVPTALMDPYAAVARHLVPARAFENGLYVAYANYCGREGDLVYCGQSVIAPPDGAEPARAARDGAALMTHDLSRETLTRGRRLNTYLADRRPELYGALGARRETP